MSNEPLPTFVPYECSLGVVLDHGDGTFYRIARPDGQVVGISANGEPSEANVEADIANPPAVVVPPPASVPLWAFRQVLLEDNLLAAIQTAVQANTLAANFLEYGNFVDRSSPLLAEIATGLGKTDAEVDDLFRRAAAIRL